MATNIDLSYTQNVHFFMENDKTKRKVIISLNTRTVQMGKKNMEDCVLPDGTIFKHWGVMAEFEETKHHKRCVYTFDADVLKESKCGKKNSDSLTDIWQLLCALMGGEFLVTAFAYGPNMENKTHPHAEHIKKLDSPQVIGEISPYELVQTARRCANKFKTKSYNFVFNNCQDFANCLLEEIEKSLENVTQTSSGAKWTSGDVTTMTAMVLGAITSVLWVFKALGTEKKKEKISDKNSSKNREI